MDAAAALMAWFPTAQALPPNPKLFAAARWAGLAYGAGLLVLWLRMGSLDGPGDLPVIITFFLWQIAPAVAVAVSVKASRTRAGQAAFLLFGAALIASTVLAYIYSFWIAPDPQMPIFLLLFLPLYQFGAFLAFLIIVSLLGRRAHDTSR